MNEDDWLAGDCPEYMPALVAPVATARQARLLAVATCRQFLGAAMPPVLAAALDVCERAADGTASDAELRAVAEAAGGPDVMVLSYIVGVCVSDQPNMPQRCIHRIGGLFQHPRVNLSAHVQAALLQDVFGNPFRPVRFDPAWHTEVAVALARTMYEARHFDRMPILADALEEAGCEVPEVLAHCRDPEAVHFRGCWVVDGVLGKS